MVYTRRGMDELSLDDSHGASLLKEVAPSINLQPQAFVGSASEIVRVLQDKHKDKWHNLRRHIC